MPWLWRGPGSSSLNLPFYKSLSWSESLKCGSRGTLGDPQNDAGRDPTELRVACVARSFCVGLSLSKHPRREDGVRDTWAWSTYPDVTPEVANREFRPGCSASGARS